MRDHYDLGDYVTFTYKGNQYTGVIISIKNEYTRVDDYEGHCDGYKFVALWYTIIDFNDVVPKNADFTGSEHLFYQQYKIKHQCIISEICNIDKQLKKCIGDK